MENKNEERTYSYDTVIRLKRKIIELTRQVDYPKVWFEEIVTDNSLTINCILELKLSKHRIKASTKLFGENRNEYNIARAKEILLNKLAIDRFNKAVKYWEMNK